MEITVLRSPKPEKRFRTKNNVYYSMLLSLFEPKASVKPTGIVLFTFSHNFNSGQNRCTNSSDLKQFQKLTPVLAKNLNFSLSWVPSGGLISKSVFQVHATTL